jgi:flagellar basal body-associated protein FliL
VFHLEGKSIYTILLGIIAVLTLALAVLIIFLFISYKPNQQAGNVAQPQNSAMAERVVADDEMLEFKLFEGKEKMFALKGEKDHPDSIIMVSVTLKCDAGPKKKKEQDITNRVNAYISELEEAVGDYFAGMTLTEAKELETRYKARDDLLNTFNEILNANKQEKEKVVYRVTLQMFPQ